MHLSPTEEQLMKHLWTQKQAFMKELLKAYDEPKPATTTVATLLKRMMDKGFVAYREYGNSRQYFPLVTQQAYFASQVKNLIKSFFDNSPTQFASFFTTQTDLSTHELETLKHIIEEQLDQKKK
jgi:predicted transcriptional regulator